MKMKSQLIVVVLAIIILSLPAFAQTTAEDWFSKGNALFNQSNYNESIQAYDKAIELNPQFALYWNGKGNSLNAQNKRDEAIQAYDKAIEIDPQYAMPWTNKGKTLHDQGK